MARLEIDAMSARPGTGRSRAGSRSGCLGSCRDARLKANSERDATQQALVATEEACQKADEEFDG